MIEVNDNWCKGCSICIDRCPVGALEESDILNLKGIHPPRLKSENTCNFCRLCELLCPDFALTVKPDKDTKDEEKKSQKTSLLRSIVGGKTK